MSSNPDHTFPPTDNFNHISFSFDNLRIQDQEPRKTIDQYLRLKTNESIQEKCNMPAKRSLCYRRSLRGSEADHDSEYQMQLRNDEQSLRIESLTKQYQLKLAKQEQFFSLRQWKLKEEVENLTHQIGCLNEEVRRLRAAGKQQTSHCSLCSDGQVIAHLNAVIKEAEDSHRHCLDEKKEMTRKVDESRGKLQVMEEQGERAYQQCKALNKQVRTLNSQIHMLEQQNLQLKGIQQSLKDAAAKKQAEWSSQRRSLERSLEEMRRKSSVQKRREEQSIANSKATTQSMLSSIQTSMHGSFMKHETLQRQQRSSSSKMPLQQCQDINNSENYLYLRKMNDYPARPTHKLRDGKSSNKVQNMKWRLF